MTHLTMESSLNTGWEVMMVNHLIRLFLLSSIKSLDTPTMFAISLAGGSLGVRRYGNLNISCVRM